MINESLLASCVDGNPNAWKDLIVKYDPELERYIQIYVGNIPGGVNRERQWRMIMERVFRKSNGVEWLRKRITFWINSNKAFRND